MEQKQHTYFLDGRTLMPSSGHLREDKERSMQRFRGLVMVHLYMSGKRGILQDLTTMQSIDRTLTRLKEVHTFYVLHVA